MTTPFRRVRGLSIALLVAGTAAACTQMPSSQQPVQASNPSVTYNYRTDQELLRASQNAAMHCGQYQSAPRTATLTNNADGSKTAVFECVRTSVPAPAPVNPNLSYTYRTDQELVQASQTASAYCQRYGSQPMTSTMAANSDGTRTATFQCGAR
jgi:hypothetical protein